MYRLYYIVHKEGRSFHIYKSSSFAQTQYETENETLYFFSFFFFFPSKVTEVSGIF